MRDGLHNGNITRRNILQSVFGISVSAALADSAFASPPAETSSQQGFGPEMIEKNKKAGFNFPYFLYAPENGRNKPLLVECVNSGSPSDDMADHIDAAENTIEFSLSRTVSDELGVPFLVPVIKDPRSGEFSNIRTQSLDTETMNIADGRYARIDKQVVRMVDDAQQRLSDYGYDLPDDFMLNGFSQSGNFGNNLALLQPERVTSVTAGGVNGLGILPLEEARGEDIKYQIGTNDFESLTGKEFDREAWRDVSQLCYIGRKERIPYDDTIPYSDVWGDREQAQRAVDIYGFDIQRERMVYSDSVYQQEGADTRFQVYDDYGHNWSGPKVVRDTLGFHARNTETPYISVVRGLISGTEEVELEVFVPEGNSQTQEVRAFIDGSEVSAEPAEIRRGESNRIVLPLTSTLELEDTIEVAVFNPDETDRANALHTNQRQVVFGARFRTTPEPGDTSIEVEYEVANARVQLNLLTDNGALYWQRRSRLQRIGPNESGTDVFEFTRHDEGVPFESGDELELQASLPGEPRDLRSVLDTATVGDPDSFDPANHAIGEVSRDDIEVAFRSPPTVDATTIDVECSVDSSFDQDVGLKLFPETGTGRWGIASDWDFDSGWKLFPSIEPGDTVAGEYDVPPMTFASSDGPALGSSVELRVYPDDWGSLSDFVASTKEVLSGVRFKSPPMAETDTVSIEYLYPSTFEQRGQIRLQINGAEIDAVDNIEPGTLDSHTFSIGQTQGISPNDEVTVSLGPEESDPFDEAQQTALPSDVGAVSFETIPAALDESISLDYRLDADFDTNRFAALRLYTDQTSAWGVHLGRVEPGSDTVQSIDINTDEACVPFQSGTEVTIKLVDWDDPYGTLPLATTSAVVGQQLPTVADYTDEDGIVDTSGLQDAIADLRSGKIDTDLLRAVMDAWKTGDPVD